jgi:hypothetical protein
MNEMKIINAPEFIAERQRKFDEIVGAAYVNIFTLSKNSEVIAIAPFNPKNKEHLFVLNVAKGVGGVAQKTVAIDASKFCIWKLNRGLDQECRYEKLKACGCACAIDPNVLLDFMRQWASELMGEENFDFGKIYDEFYSKKGKRK